MKLSFRERGDVTILDAEGPYTVSEGLPKVVAAIEKFVADGKTKFLLNLAGIPYIDSMGLAHIVAGFNTSTKAGGTLKLLSPSQKIVEMLTTTRLNEVIGSYSDESTALNSFRS